MKKKRKIELTDLQISSFVTAQKCGLKGGLHTVNQITDPIETTTDPTPVTWCRICGPDMTE